jgi:hypothetical protein
VSLRAAREDDAGGRRTAEPDTPEEASTMPLFMDVHSGFFGVTAEELAAAHQRDLDTEADDGVHFEHAWLDPEAGKVFCLATGPDKEAIMRVHERSGHPTSEVYEIPIQC